MAISDNGLSAADIAAVTGANNGFGFGNDGGAFWLLVLFLLCFFTLSTFAVEYRSVGSNANFCAYTFDGKYYLILSFKDDDENFRLYGIIAQEAQEVGLNDIVRIKEDGKLGVDYISFLVLRNAYLEDFCANLNGRLAALEDKLNKLENKD